MHLLRLTPEALLIIHRALDHLGQMLAILLWVKSTFCARNLGA